MFTSIFTERNSWQHRTSLFVTCDFYNLVVVVTGLGFGFLVLGDSFWGPAIMLPWNSSMDDGSSYKNLTSSWFLDRDDGVIFKGEKNGAETNRAHKN